VTVPHNVGDVSRRDTGALGGGAEIVPQVVGPGWWQAKLETDSVEVLPDGLAMVTVTFLVSKSQRSLNLASALQYSLARSRFVSSTTRSRMATAS